MGADEAVVVMARQWRTCERREGWEGMDRPGVEVAEAAAEGAAETLDHGGDAGDVVVGGADEGEEALDGVLPQHPHPCQRDVVRGRRAGAAAVPHGATSPGKSLATFRKRGSAASQARYRAGSATSSWK